jgi:large-conductance mechanosensitive channel
MNYFSPENASRFIIYNAAALAIGMATLGLIKSSISDFIMPILFLIFVNGTKNISRGTAAFFQKVLTNKELRFTNFITEVLTWVLVVVIAIYMAKQVLKLGYQVERFDDYPKKNSKHQVERFETVCPPCKPCPAVGNPPMVADEMMNEMDYSNFYLNNT